MASMSIINGSGVIIVVVKFQPLSKIGSRPHSDYLVSELVAVTAATIAWPANFRKRFC